MKNFHFIMFGKILLIVAILSRDPQEAFGK